MWPKLLITFVFFILLNHATEGQYPKGNRR